MLRLLRWLTGHSLVEAVLGLWVVPFAPLAVGALVAWATSWAFPSLVMVGFLIGWPVVWFRWVQSAPAGDEENAG